MLYKPKRDMHDVPDSSILELGDMAHDNPYLRRMLQEMVLENRNRDFVRLVAAKGREDDSTAREAAIALAEVGFLARLYDCDSNLFGVREIELSAYVPIGELSWFLGGGVSRWKKLVATALLSPL